MPIPNPTSADSALEECLDELNDCLATLDRFPHTVLAFALRTHLASLLRALLAHGECTQAEAVMFVRDLESEALDLAEGD